MANKKANLAVTMAKMTAFERLYMELEEKDGDMLYRQAKARKRRSSVLDHVRCIKDEDGKILRSAGRDHVIPMQNPNAFKRYMEKQILVALLQLSNLRKDVVTPYGHVVESFEADNLSDPYDSRTTLVFFRGRTDRKAEGKDRKRLEKLLSGQKDVLKQMNTQRKGMRSSKFCLDPAGDTPSSSSCRLSDAIINHCVPVIVSDKIELPFEDEIDYNKFSIFFSREEAKKEGYILDQLGSIPKTKWFEMWRYLENITHHFEYQYPLKKGDAVNMIWRQVKHKLPAVKPAVHRNRRLKVPDWWR
ncbi:hypothetical protein RND71_039838 [Anisodus tanguticus]|uniref:Exostosin GT47 domain-containing protein n=1 Tax=Anisodus tanguticus TaxID=243964 RepID=A0AAE1QZW7_9SOLA|nr:hypothetical protein RND71_039838 [Anisodus tanguticus]